MRNSCIDCVLKHIVSAHILLHEAKLGYPDHVYLAIGHLAQAEVELASKHLGVAQDLRVIRKRIEEEENADFDVLEWIQKLGALDVDDVEDVPEDNPRQTRELEMLEKGEDKGISKIVPRAPEGVPHAGHPEPAGVITYEYQSEPIQIVAEGTTTGMYMGPHGETIASKEDIENLMNVSRDSGDAEWDDTSIEPDIEPPRKSLWQSFKDMANKRTRDVGVR